MGAANRAVNAMRSAGPAEEVASPYRELVCVLLLTSLMVAAHALSPVDLQLGDYSLARPSVALTRRLPMPSVPLASSPASRRPEPKRTDIAAGAQAPSTADQGDVSRRQRPPVDRRPQRILLFGDSMVPVIAPRLADYCAQSGHELFPVVWYGGTIMLWGWQPRLSLLITELRPTMVIAALGSTELRTRDTELRRDFVGMIVRKVGSRHFAWIGPPNWRDDTGINALLLEELGPGRFFSSASLELERKSDGIHPTLAAGAKWVDRFVAWLGNDGDHPIELAQPEHRAPPVAARVYHDIPDIPGSPGRYWPFRPPTDKRADN